MICDTFKFHGDKYICHQHAQVTGYRLLQGDSADAGIFNFVSELVYSAIFSYDLIRNICIKMYQALHSLVQGKTDKPVHFIKAVF
jgi:hypothetical protein